MGIGKLLKIFMAILCLDVAIEAFAAGSRVPEAEGPQPPRNTQPEVGVPDLDRDRVANLVDGYNGMRELVKSRRPASYVTDSCTDLNVSRNDDAFIDSLAYMVEHHIEDRPVDLSGIETAYNLRSSPIEVGLMSHAMCKVDRSSLGKILNNVPDSATIDLVNKFSDRYNKLRNSALSGSENAKTELGELWLHFMGCLAYTESLSTADTSSSKSVAKSYAPSSYSKPDGVKFYYDRAQSNPSSRLNIGLFQFSPNATGNIFACIRGWNREIAESSSCKIKSNETQANLVRSLGSSNQHFNAYCGVNKVLHTFYTQVNTLATNKTHPANVSSGSIKKPEDRCVTLHMRSGLAYNHFGPFHNSTGSNLKKLMSCAVRF